MPPSTSWNLRRATGADALAVADEHVRSWRAAYRGIVPDAYLDGLDVTARASRYTFDLAGPDDPETWIALDGDIVVGHVSVGPCRDDDPPGFGEVRSLYVAPDRWRTGAGSALLAKGEQLILARGFTDALLWVFEANGRGRRFYESAGWRADGRTYVEEFGGRELVEVRYRKRLAERRP